MGCFRLTLDTSNVSVSCELVRKRAKVNVTVAAFWQLTTQILMDNFLGVLDLFQVGVEGILLGFSKAARMTWL